MTVFEHLQISGLFDSHAHLAYSPDEQVKVMIRNAKAANLQAVFNMGIDIESSRKVIQQAKDSNNYAKAFIGIDPEVFEPNSDMFVGLENGEAWIEQNIKLLKDILISEKEFVTGIGETGMDFYHFEQDGSTESVKQKSKSLQEILFRKHLQLAQEFDLPLSIHSRRAEAECLKIVKEYSCKGIFHSYTGNYTTAAEILNAGWGLGVNGIVTFKKADEIRNVYKEILKHAKYTNPQDFYNQGIFFETDSPFLSPEGKRGLVNEPSNTKIIFEFFNTL